MPQRPQTLYRAAQVRELDRIAIEDFGIPGYDLMRKAGHAVFQCIQTKWTAARALRVYCGSGNNAGDGFVIARLGLDAGWNVRAIGVGDPAKLRGDALRAYQDYLQAGGLLEPWSAEPAQQDAVIVDALLGTGLDREVSGNYADAIAAINRAGLPVVAVDMPSGLNADTGNAMGHAVKADCTVTFIGLKQGLFTGQAAEHVGDIIFDDLAVPDRVFQNIAAHAELICHKPMPPRPRCAHKGDMGHVLVVGGDLGFSGAARMAGEAALRIGAGLVTVATRKAHAGLLNLHRPELMCHGVESADELLPLLDKADVLALGPGLGQGAWGKALFEAVLALEKPLVLDADGLNLLAEAPVSKAHWILTPHPGEAGRLLHNGTASVQADRFAAVAALRAQYGGVAVLKGAGSLVASAARIGVATPGNPGMASGGMGDVLTGVIAGLLAQGLPSIDAAEQGVYLHGRAADLAAAQAGERGLLATDLFPFLRQLVN